MSTLQGKAVVITGSGGGIGAAYARLAGREGALVVVNDLDQAAVDSVVGQITEAGGTATGVVASVADPAQAESLIDACVERYGRIDGLVNNAGVMFVGPSTDLDPGRTRKLFEVNVFGTIFCGTPALRRMLAQGSGSIVNVTSGAHMGLSNTAIYGASKGAIAALTYDWAADTAGTGVRVNAVSPMAGTRMAADVLAEQGVPPSQRDARLKAFPTPEDNAAVACYLLSDGAGDVHGQVLRIDGGELSVVGRPAILRPSVTAEAWTVEDVEKAIRGPLAGLLNPTGLLQVTGDFTYSSIRSSSGVREG